MKPSLKKPLVPGVTAVLQPFWTFVLPSGRQLVLRHPAEKIGASSARSVDRAFFQRGLGGRAWSVGVQLRGRTTLLLTGIFTCALCRHVARAVLVRIDVRLRTSNVAGSVQDRPVTVTTLMQDASVKALLEAVRLSEPRTLEQQVRICEVPAPPFKESARAQVLKQLFEGVGLQRPDRSSRQCARRSTRYRGTSAARGRAHLDTVFPREPTSGHA
jgi:hypothetical protein